jgi:predicted amidohydrolase YtcJ
MGALILHGGQVLTMDDRDTRANAVAIDHGRVLGVGERRELERSIEGAVECRDLRGGTVLPGLIDTHPHLMHFGVLAEPLVDIGGATSWADIVSGVAQRAADTPPGSWIMTTPVGEPHYFIRRSYRDLAEGELPDRSVLDVASASHPVMIQAWAPVTPNVCAFNSLGLERLGIDASTPDRVENVWIEKDAGGQPTRS